MNHTYRLIYNAALQLWVAVAETARGRGKAGKPARTRSRSQTRLAAAQSPVATGTAMRLSALALAMLAPSVWAGPVGGQVTSGSGSISQSGAPGNTTTTVTQTSPTLSLNWQSFNTTANETVNFVQPSASAIAVNRVLDANPTQFMGRLNANGQVWLINPNGVLFGQTAQVNVGGLVASTLDVSDSALANNSRTFTGTGTGSVINQGSLNGRYVALIGNTVKNTGTLTTDGGTAALGAGQKVTLNFADNRLLSLQVDAGVLNALAENGGLIRADGGTVLLSAGARDELLASVVNHTGVIQAHTVDNQSGTIVLLGGMKAGTTQVTGTLDASAPNGGDGGFIETSAAKIKLDHSARIIASASKGKNGQYLIDPTDFTVAPSGGDITGADISNLLNTGLSVTIRTSTDGSCLNQGGVRCYVGSSGSNGDIHINDTITWGRVSSTLTFIADRDININGSLNWVYNPLTLQANRNINLNPGGKLNGSGQASLEVKYGLGAVAQNNTANFNLNGGVITLPSGQNFSSQLGSNGIPVYHKVITTGTELQKINDNLYGAYALGSDIDVSNSGFFTALGTASAGFKGIFNGLGHTIRNLYIHAPISDMQGLFGYVDQWGIISNVGLVDSIVLGNNQVGGLVGYNQGVIRNSYAASYVSGVYQVGGLVGYNQGTINQSYATRNSNYSASVVASYGDVGGLVGNNYGTITQSYATGRVNASSDVSNIGGLVGLNGGTVSTSKWDSYATNQSAGIGAGNSSGAAAVTSDPRYANAANYAYKALAWSILGGGSGGDIDTVGGQAKVWRMYEGYSTPLLKAFMQKATVSASSATTTYNGLNQSGQISATTTLADGSSADSNLVKGTATWACSGGDASCKNAGSYKVAVNGGLYSTQQGYDLVYQTPATNNLTIGKADLTQITASKTYDGLDTVTASQITQIAGVNGETFSATAGTASISDKNVATANKTVTDLSGLTLSGNSGASTGNYNLTSSLPTGSHNAVTIGKADLTLSGSRSYDGTTVVKGSDVTATGVTVNGVTETFALSGNGDSSNLASKNASTTAQTLASTTGLSLGTGSNGALSSNYNAISTTGSSFTINKANLTVTANAVTKTYDGTTTASGTGTVGTLAGAGDVVNNAGQQAFTDKNAGSGNKTVRASGVTIKDSANADMTGNYNITYTDNTASTINKADLTVTANAVTKTYDGTTTASGTGTVGTLAGAGDVVNNAGQQAFTDKNAGSGNKTVRASGVTIKDSANADMTGNYNITYTDNTASTINKADLTVTANAVTKTYDGTTSASGTGTVGTLAGAGDVVNNAGQQAFTDKNAGSGNKTVRASGVTIKDSANADMTGNYNITYTDNTASTINKADLTVTANAVTKTYDGTTSASGMGTVGTLAGAAAGDVVNSAGRQDFTDKNAGSGNKTVRASGVTIKDGNNADMTSNYNITYTDHTASTINKATLALALADQSKTYDGKVDAAIAAGQVTATGVTVNGSTESASFKAVSGSYNNKNVANASSVTASVNASDVNTTANGFDANNYTLSDSAKAVTGNGAISKADLTVTANAVTKTYDGTTSASGTGTVGTLAGAGDVVNNAGQQAFTDKNAGSGNKTVRASGVTIKDSANADMTGNYNITYTDNTASTINKADLTVTANAVTKTYDGTTSASGMGTVGTLAGAAAGDVVNSAGQQAFTDKNAGTGNKTVRASGVTIKDGNNADMTSNYNITYTDNTASTINKADLTVTANAVTKTYDGTTSASGMGTVGTLAGAAAGDVVNSAGRQDFTDKNAGSGNKTVRASGVTIKDGNNADMTSNYNITYTDHTASTINKADLTVTANAVTKTYDGTTSATGTGTVGTLAGAAAGDVVNSAGRQDFTDKNAGSGNKTVRASGVTIKDSANADMTGNYNITYTDNTASTINKADLTVTANAVTKTYDGTTSASGMGTVGTLAGAAAGDVVNSAGRQDFTDKNAGSGNKTVRASGVTIKDGNNADMTSNYNITYTDNTASTINKADLTVTANAVTKTYDGTTSASGMGTVGTLAGAAAGDVVNSAGRQDFTDKNAGSGNKTVRASGVTIKDGNNADMTSNYNITYTDHTASTINKADLTVTANAVTKTYDGTTSATGTGTVGTLAGAAAGDVVNSAGRQDFTDKNAGSGNKTVRASGVTIKDGSNADMTGNYNITYTDHTASTINKADLTVTANAVTKTYDGTTSATGTGTVGTLAGAAAGDVVNSAGQQAFTDKNAGTGNKTVRASGVTIKDSANADMTGNYNIRYTDYIASTINKANLTVTARDDSKSFDGTAYKGGNGVTYSGFVPGESASSLGGALAYEGSSQGAVGAGRHVIRAKGLSSNNYAIRYVDGALLVSAEMPQALIKAVDPLRTLTQSPISSAQPQALQASTTIQMRTDSTPNTPTGTPQTTVFNLGTNGSTLSFINGGVNLPKEAVQ